MRVYKLKSKAHALAIGKKLLPLEMRADGIVRFWKQEMDVLLDVEKVKRDLINLEKRHAPWKLY